MDHIVNSYKSGKSMSEISKLYKISRQSISKILKINNIQIINKRRRIYNPNHSFFSNINSESKAYMLGFIFADGSIYQNRIRIELSSKDKHILEIFSNEIYKLNLVKDFNKNNKSYCLLDIHSEQIKEDLKKYSCISNKSKILTFPNINQNLHNHFIRGLIDGDGFVSVNHPTLKGGASARSKANS